MKQEIQHPLTETQNQILTLLYKFKYLSVPLLTEYKTLKSNSVQRTLDKLIEHKLVDRKWDKSYVKTEIPAIYYLTKNGIAQLRKDDRIDTAVLNTYYGNGDRSMSHMLHKLEALKAFLAVRATYKDHFQIFTQQEVMTFDDFPMKKPDLFLRARDNASECFIYLVHDIQPYLSRKLLKELIRHYDEEGWDNGDYPSIHLVFADSKQESRFLEFAKNQMESDGLDDDELLVATTTSRGLLSKPYVSTHWTFVGDDPMPRALSL